VKRVLALSSGGGHFVELVRLRAAFADAEVTWATVSSSYASHVPGERLLVVPDATRWDRVRLAAAVLRIGRILRRERPDVVVSTGALPGFFAVALGRAAGARTIFVDSFANVEELSLSGRLASRVAHLALTQWPELARAGGPCFEGSVLGDADPESATTPAASLDRPLRVFVTVGAQMPFDRMIEAVEKVAIGRRLEVFVQTGVGGRRGALGGRELVPPAEFQERYDWADLIVAHAGTGSILAALEVGKPIAVMARRAAWRETRNDHQIATAARFRARFGVPVFDDAGELASILDERRFRATRVSRDAEPRLIETVRRFIAA
jgi:UDP-N-acetylglucosamine transferase subunit ALG13